MILLPVLLLQEYFYFCRP